MLTLGAFGLTFLAFERTVGAIGLTLGDLGIHLGDFWLHLGGLGGSLGILWLILEPLGCILGGLGRPKPAQSGPGRRSLDIAKTRENRRVFMGLGGWRLPGWHQNCIVDASVAHRECWMAAGWQLAGWLPPPRCEDEVYWLAAPGGALPRVVRAADEYVYGPIIMDLKGSFFRTCFVPHV